MPILQLSEIIPKYWTIEQKNRQLDNQNCTNLKSNFYCFKNPSLLKHCHVSNLRYTIQLITYKYKKLDVVPTVPIVGEN
jgi:hypothetical protein